MDAVVPDGCVSNLKFLEELQTVLSSRKRGASDKVSLTREHAVRVSSGFKEPRGNTGRIRSSNTIALPGDILTRVHFRHARLVAHPAMIISRLSGLDQA